MTRWASRASVNAGVVRASPFRYSVKINPLLVSEPIPDGFRDLDQVLDELVDDVVSARLGQRRAAIAEEICAEARGLKYLRLKCGLSQTQLADLVGTSQPRLSVWETDPKSISSSSVRALAAALEVDFNTFFKVVFGE
jgi:DNA-binding transcriptional regulator YiaG